MKVIPIEVVRSALKLRTEAALSPTNPVDVYQLAELRGLEVRFLRVSSLEGMYVAGRRPAILLPAERPSGRQHFACAHELAHHEFRHGVRLDLLRSHSALRTGEEYVADLFAGFLLMPKLAVLRAFVERGADPSDPTAEQVIRAAQWLRVGYSSLLQHMRSSLDLLDPSQMAALKSEAPRRLIESVLERTVDAEVILLDELWDGLSIDITVGQYISLSRADYFDENFLEVAAQERGNVLLRGIRPGVARLHGATWSAFVRISRPNYEGLAQYRHLADPEYDE